MKGSQGTTFYLLLVFTLTVVGARWGAGNFVVDSQNQQVTNSADVRLEESNTFHVVSDCVTISMDEGVFHYRSKGSSTTCGLYFVAEPQKSIRITIEYLNVNCQQEGLISVVDGWELNGEIFPSPRDHELNLPSRFNEFCGREERRKRSFTSSQNAALVQYRIPVFGQGFSVRVQHVLNPKPCNILVEDLEGIYTLENFGREVNCSLTTLFHSKMRILYLSTGGETPGHTATLHQCGKRGFEDYVEIGGSSGIDSANMNVVQEFCGHDPKPGGFTRIFCGVTSVRLVSSGGFKNKVVVEVRKLELEELDLANYICDF